MNRELIDYLLTVDSEFFTEDYRIRSFRRWMDYRIGFIHGLEEGKAIGKQVVIQENKYKTKMEHVRNLLSMNEEREIIVRMTGLSLEEIDALAMEMQ